MGEVRPILPAPGDAGPGKALEKILVGTAQAVRARGVRGLDAEGLAADIASKWIRRESGGGAYSAPTLTFVRREVWLWRRSEARAHAREAEAGRRLPPDGDPAESLEREEECAVLLRAIRRACDGVSTDDRHALSLRLRGKDLLKIGESLGGSESRWSRRIHMAAERFRRLLEAGGCSTDCMSAGFPDLQTLVEVLEPSGGPEARRPLDAPSAPPWSP